MKTFWIHNKKIIKKAIIIILALLCLASLVWFVITIKDLHESGELKVNYDIRKYQNYPHNIVTINNLKAWMTFDYINVVFKLDRNYLKNTFMIDDPRYPNIRLDSYAKHHNLNQQQFLQDIEQAITNYPNNK